MSRAGRFTLIMAILTLGGVALLIGSAPKAKAKAPAPTQLQRGEYLVKFGDCTACHTPLKFGPNGPEPDLTKFLSGHPADTKLRDEISL